MNLQRVAVSKLRANLKNPRIIKDEKFQKLVQSIKDFPEMLELRPIVVDADYVVLGGNMRLKACQAAGLKEVPVAIASDLTPDQQREFVIKDNVGFGEWEWEALANDWDLAELKEWGLAEVSSFQTDAQLAERDVDLSIVGDMAERYLNNAIRQIVLHYDQETHAAMLHRLETAAAAFGTENDNSATVLALLDAWERRTRT
jgi:hypothetical protein